MSRVDRLFIAVLMLLVVVPSAWSVPPQVGQPAPPLTVDQLLQAGDGASATLEDLRGKIVVVEFWATWCGPCVAAMPHLNEVATELRDEPVVFPSITSETIDEVKPFLETRHIRGWVGVDPDRSTLSAYEPAGIPHTFVIGKDGTLLADTRPLEVTTDKLRALLRGEPAAFAPARSQALPARPEQPLLAKAEIRPSEYDESVRSSLGEWIMSGKGSKAEYIVKDAFSGERVLIEAELPEGLFDYEIRVGRDLPDADARLEALANDALAAAWGVRGRREKREVDVYVLKAGEATYALMTKATTGGMVGGKNLADGRVRVESMNGLPAQMTSTLEHYIDRPIIDDTAITWHGGMADGVSTWGHGFDFAFEFENENVESLRAALKRDLDIDLVSEKREVEFVVIAPVATEQSTRPTTDAVDRPGDQLTQMAQRMTAAMEAVPGCLGTDYAQMGGSGKAVIFGWFKDKHAALAWYNHPMHVAVRRMSKLDGAAGANREPLAGVPEGVPVMALACMTFDGPPAVEGSPIPFSAISIELYSALEGGLRLNGGFAPAEFAKLPRAAPSTRATTRPADTASR